MPQQVLDVVRRQVPVSQRPVGAILDDADIGDGGLRVRLGEERKRSACRQCKKHDYLRKVAHETRFRGLAYRQSGRLPKPQPKHRKESGPWAKGRLLCEFGLPLPWRW